MCVHFDIASVGYRSIYWLDLLHDFVDPCGKFHLPLTCFQLYIWVYMQIVYKGFIILLLALVYIYLYTLMLGLKYSFNEIYS